MKHTLIIFAFSFIVFTSAIRAEEAKCPNWPVTLIQKNVAGKLDQDISIKLAKNLIKNEAMLGDREMQISSEFSTYAEIKGNNVEIN